MEHYHDVGTLFSHVERGELVIITSTVLYLLISPQLLVRRLGSAAGDVIWFSSVLWSFIAFVYCVCGDIIALWLTVVVVHCFVMNCGSTFIVNWYVAVTDIMCTSPRL